MVYVFLAEGFEMVEALTPVDILRRAGIETVTVSIMNEKTVTSSHNVGIVADIKLDEVKWDEADALVLPGGMPGTKKLAACEVLMSKVCDFAGKKATCYPDMEEHLKGATFVTDEVVTDGNIITSRGMGTAINFGLAIVEKLIDKAKADEIGEKIVYRQ